MRIVRDHDTGLSRGFGFLQLLSGAEADLALKMSGSVFVGSRPIRVERWQSRTQDRIEKKNKKRKNAGDEDDECSSKQENGVAAPPAKKKKKKSKETTEAVTPTKKVGDKKEKNKSLNSRKSVSYTHLTLPTTPYV